MSKGMSIMMLELPAVRKMMHDEIWYEGERRHCPVDWHDLDVINRVCEILIRTGGDLLKNVISQANPSNN